MKTLILTITEALLKAKRTTQFRRYAFFMNKPKLCSLFKNSNSNMEPTGLQKPLSVVFKYSKHKNLITSNLIGQPHDSNK